MHLLSRFRSALLASVSLPLLAVPVCVFAGTAAAAADASTAVDAGEATKKDEKAKSQEAAADGDAVEEMVVTARRRSETLFNVPASVSAISGDALRDAGISDMKDVIALIPNAVIPTNPDNSNTYVNIRGIRQADLYAEPNFGLYRNGIFYGGSRSNLGSQVDVERIEVLRGPQGGLYGRNALGGAINVIYATPTDEFGGYARASYGRYDRTELEGAINAPVNSKFSTRMAGWWFNQEKGEYYNETLHQEIDKGYDKGLRFSAKAQATEDLSILWVAEYQKTEGPALRAYAPNGVLNDVALGTNRSDPESYRTIHQDTPSRATSETYYVSQNIAYETDIGLFNLLASYKDYDHHSIQDADYTDFAPTTLGALQRVMKGSESTNDFYVEGLWTSKEDMPLTWIAGVSYFDETFDYSRVYDTTLNIAPFPGAPAGYSVVSGSAGLPLPGTSIKTKSISTFAELTYHFTDDLSVFGGLRWTQDKKTLNFAQGIIPGSDPAVNGYLAALFGSAAPSYKLHDAPKFHFLAPSTGINYKATENVNLYALYSTGFRAGSFNASTSDPAFVPYGQESAKNYEVGVKTQWLDGKLGLNLAAFIMDQKDLVVQFDDPNDNTYGYYYLGNAGDARTYGVEFEGFARIAPWLTGAASVGYLHDRFTKGLQYPGTSYEFDLTGTKIPYTRDWTMNVRLDAKYPVSDKLTLVGSAAVREEIGGILDPSLQTPYENLTKIDLTGGVVINGSTRLTAFVNNLLDDRIVEFEYYAGPVSTSYGRTFGVQVSHDF